MRAEYGFIAVVALCWGGYPLLSRWSGYGEARGALILMVFGSLPILASSFSGASDGWPSGAAFAKLAVAGMMMGVGLVAFHALANSPMEASLSIPIVDVAMLLVSTVGAMMFFAESITVQKTLGVLLMLGGIALLRPA